MNARVPLRASVGLPFAPISFGGAFSVVALLAGLAVGPVPLPPSELLAILAAGPTPPEGLDLAHHAIVWVVRLPRVLLGFGVGAGLAICGAAMQGLFRNPLADPGLLGVSLGAAAGVCGVIVLGGATSAAMGLWLQPAAGFVGALLATIVMASMGTVHGRSDTPLLLLAGIAVQAIAGAVVGMLLFVADDAAMRSFTFWSLGSVGGGNWATVGVTLGLVGASTALLLRLAPSLDRFSLGESDAFHLGVHVEHTKRLVIAAVAVAVGAAVAATGAIGFVGLVVPHIGRMAVGPLHGRLLAIVALGGGSLLVLADLVARTMVAPTEIPVGVLTTLLGGPFFLVLLLRARSAA